MRFIQALILFVAIFGLVNSSSGELFQLGSVQSKTEKDKIRRYTSEELLEIERGKIFIIDFLKAPFDEKWKLTTKKYKDVYKSVEFLKRAFDKESYSQIDFIRIGYHEKTPLSMAIKINLYWAFEGFEGVTTYYFMLEKENDKWLLNWLVY